ncbi:MAG TPA: AMP-binding protein [Candidatus Sulfotelmatobacter sp.]|nr:AMP-binding protein [Candidatus Sulfotelmatobacter sp.]
MDIVGDRTLYSIFRSYAASQPDRLWLTYEGPDEKVFRWTFSQFLAAIHQTANFLVAMGIHEGDVINLHLANHPAYPQVILAASYLGAIVLPTSPSATAEELRYFQEHSEAKLVITNQKSLGAVESATRNGSRAIVLVDEGHPEPNYPCYDAEVARQKDTAPHGAGGADKVLQLLYTSGTTSRPKGVMLTNANFIYGSEVFRAATGLRNDDCHLIALPLYHSAAQCHALWPALISGCSVAIVSRFSASAFFEQAVRYDATMAALFGAPLRMLLNQPPRESDRQHRLRNITYAQNLTDAQYTEWHRRFGAPLQQLWGMTELAALPIMSPLSGERRLQAMGRPVLGYELKVVDEDGRELPPNSPGQLIVRAQPGRSVMRGYLKNEEATQKALRQVDGHTWMFSGDTAQYDEDGFFYFLDRSSDMIKRSGLNISTAEVESVIAALEGVADVCVCGLPDATRDESVAAVVVRKPGVELTHGQIRAHCAANLASYKVPERIEFSDSLPRTSVGKIRKNIIRDRLLSSAPRPDPNS